MYNKAIILPYIYKLMDTKDYIKIFEQSSALLLVIDTNFAIVAASDAFLKSTSIVRGSIVGRNIFDVFPDNPADEIANGKSKVIDSFNLVLKNKVPDTMPVVKYDIPKPVSEGSGFEVRYWQVTHTPLLDEQQNVKYIIQQSEDVTENKILITQLKYEQRALKQLADSEKRYNMMLMKSPFGFAVLKGKNMVITLANDSVKAFWGKGKDVEGKPLFDVLFELKDSAFPGLLDNVYTTGVSFFGNELLASVLRNGKQEDVYFNFVYQPYLEADETISGVTIIAYEVTKMVLANKKIAESEVHFRQLADLMPAKISHADATGNVFYFNKNWLDYSGYNFEELRDFGYHKIIHPDELDEFQKRLQKAGETGTVLEMEMRFMNKEGDYRWHLNLASPIKDENGEMKMWVGSTTDIHEQKEAKSNAETAMIAKQLFLSNMSHEIRTPINAVIGFTNVILKTALSEKQKEYVNAIKVSGDALIVLINDILDLAKVDAGKMTFEQSPFSLSTSIATTLHLFEPKIQEKNLELIEKYDAAIPEVLLGDSVRLRQIVLNLLGNAVKFTHEGKITVSVRLLKEAADFVTLEFSITDTGIGIPENKLEHIFGDFEQATNETSRIHGGTGLGLSIVKQFVELQGGTLFINSKLGEGSTFGFVLDFKKAISSSTETSSITSNVHDEALAERIENIKVLVAEDMPLNQLLIKIILNDFGFEVDIAGNGKIAIENLEENKYDIILMDLQMPEMNGFEATAHIRGKMNMQIPIIALTADVTTVDLEKCKAIGMNDYISKPVDEKLLYNKIITYLKEGTN